MKAYLAVAFFGFLLASNIYSAEIYSESIVITVDSKTPGKPIVCTGNQKYRIDDRKLYITRADGTEYFYNTIEKTKEKLRFTCGNKFLVYKDESKTELIVSHFDEIESKIIYLKKNTN